MFFEGGELPFELPYPHISGGDVAVSIEENDIWQMRYIQFLEIGGIPTATVGIDTNVYQRDAVGTYLLGGDRVALTDITPRGAKQYNAGATLDQAF